LFASRAKIEVETKGIIQSEDLALMPGKWTLTAWGADGRALKRTGVATDVARRQPDGVWLIAIDNPYGVE
jgi:ketosteroid isomerase-like protein